MSEVVPSEVSPPAQRKLYLISYGCQMNDYDSAKMADVLSASHGYARTQNPDEADLLLRSGERRVGKECVRTCRSRWSPDNKKVYDVGSAASRGRLSSQG